MKILCIGNSFSQDTTRLLPEVMKSLGFENFLVANLYIGGCPIHKHYENIREDLAAYDFYRNDGSGWKSTPETKISEAIRSESWDVVCIQHGSSYGGRYTEEESYRNLPALVQAVKAQTGAKIVFNLTWVGAPEKDRPEMIQFNRDQVQYFTAICDITRQMVATVPGIDQVCPTGTAVQNGRTLGLADRMCRDGYHLSMDLGCYLAGLSFIKALTGCELNGIVWSPEGVSNAEKALVLQAVEQASKTPYYQMEG